MNRFLGRLPLSAKLVMIGLIPLIFAIFASIRLYQEKSVKVDLLRAQIDRVHQSVLITRLIDQLQTERRESYSHLLMAQTSNNMIAERKKTDSLINAVIEKGNGLADFRKYTFLTKIDDVRNNIDSGKYGANNVIHFYSTVVFRLNTLNTVPVSISTYLPDEYPALVSQKLLSEMVTYLGIISTNIHNVLYSKKYAVETLMGTVGPYEVYKTYQEEFRLKSSQQNVAKYDSLLSLTDTKQHSTYLANSFSKFVIDSSYDANEWAALTSRVIGNLRSFQEDLLRKAETGMESLYAKERRNKDNAKILLFGLFVLVFLILIVIIRSVNKSLLDLRASAEMISLGRPVQQVPETANDVIGSLRASILKIDENNKKLASAAEKIGDGNFDVEVVARSEQDLLGNAVVRMKKNLSHFTGRLADNESRIRQLLQALPVCVYTCDLDGTITEFNSAAENLWGQQPGGQANEWTAVSKMFSLEGVEFERNEFPIAQLMQGNIIAEQEVVIQRTDGQRRTVITSPQMLYGTSGNLLGAIDVMVDISDRNQVEKDTAWLASIINSTTDAIISKSLKGIITSWNPGAERLFGYTEKEMIGQHITRIIPEDRHGEEPEILSRIKNGIRIDHFETKRLRKDGRIIDISLSLSPIVDRNGKIIGVSKIARDVTERVEIMRKIQENEEKLRIAIAATKLGTWEMYPSNGELNWSDECRKIFGADSNRMTQERLLQCVHADDLPMVNEQLGKALQSATPFDFDLVFRIRRFNDHQIRWIHSKGRMNIDDTRQEKRFLGTLLDITNTKEAQRALEESEQRTRFAIQAAEMGTFEWNLETNEFISSARLRQIFGVDEKGNHVDLITRIHPEDIDIRNKAVNESRSRGSLEYEVRVVWPDGSIHWVNVFGKVIYSASDQPLRMYGTVKDVTREKTIIRHLKESEERLNIAVEAAELGTWELNYITREVNYSDRYLKILGFPEGSHPTHDELLSKIHPEDLPKRNKAMKDAVKSGHLDYEMRFLTDANTERWIRARGTIFYDKNGNPERALGTIMDTTEQRAAMHILQESEERFRIIANSAPVMIWMSGEDRFSDFFNTSWLEFTGRTIEQERGDGWLEGVHPEDKEYCQEIYQRSYRARRPFYVEYRLRRKDGVYRYISDNAVPRYDGNRRFIGFISACRDIDDEKLFNQKVRESELLFKTIANVSPVGLWMTDTTGYTTFWNDTWLEWTGIPTVDQYGDGWMKVVIMADHEYVAKKFRKSFDERKSFSIEYRIKRRDGRVRWVLSNGSPYFDIEGNFAGFAGSVADITERKEDEIRKNEFLAIASHELKTPLTSVKAYTQLLASTYQKKGDDFLKNALGKVENQVNKMTKLVGDFLNLSKIESDKFELQTEPFELSSLVKEVSSDIQLVAPNHTIHVQDGHPVIVDGDSEKIAQVVTNLLNNAVKYSPEGKEITVTVTHDERFARVYVKDRGIGIKPEEQQQIFQRFYRSKFNQNISFSGFGIGLYISAEIVQKHDGTIGVESQEGKGSTFYFTLPIAR